MVPEDQVEEQSRSVFGRDLDNDGDKMHHLLNRSTRTKTPVRSWSAGGKLKMKSILTDRHASVAMESGRRVFLRRRGRLHAPARFAGPDPLLDPRVHPRPVEVTGECRECLLAAEMTADRSIAVFVNQSSSKVVIGWYDDTRRVETVCRVRQQRAIKLVPLDVILSRTRQLLHGLSARRAEVRDDVRVERVGFVRRNDLVALGDITGTEAIVLRHSSTLVLIVFVSRRLMTGLTSWIVVRATRQRIGKDVILAGVVVNDEIVLGEERQPASHGL
ncbi:hypothetical protein PC114_g18602 [Phytophthora cactorum]|uniref:Uncharacterized protein n=1 Tax=Phytophthora cactorum TaxID=29920 RepID=A0A8T1AI78_9STRA|nr:hypothetical protein PC117_g26084 [Phytophthora cactorum]KAG2887972.1 hypothetical protein PC114_g18602 [Phytophthora cactorum]